MQYSTELNKYTFAQKIKFWDYFSAHISKHKLDLYETVAQSRTEFITVVAENIFAEQNANAIIRTAECFGLNAVHIIEEDNTFKAPKKIASGAEKWIDIHRYDKKNLGTLEILSNIKKLGYKIAATSPHIGSISPENVPIEDKVAFFLGEEETGLSSEILDSADYHVCIPMRGFTESLNVSVCAGILIQSLRHRLEQSERPWRLSNERKLEQKLFWAIKSIKGASQMLDRLI